MKLKELNFYNNSDNFWEKAIKNKSSIITAHAEMIFSAFTDNKFEKEIKKADVLVADGVGLIWGLKVLGKNVIKMSGIDLINRLIDEKPETRTYLWGGTEEIVKAAAENYKQRGLKIVGFTNGYKYSEKDVFENIKKTKAAVVFVGMGGSVKQLSLVNKIVHELNVTAMTVGGSFNVAAGKFKRAPKFFQILGVEWLWRTLIEPKRIKKIPYLIGFVFKVMGEKIWK